MSLNTDGTYGGRNPAPIQTRPYDFGTDAIERQRVSLGQSMMDADFEYGLQATKWQTYVDIRKIPSFFEIPGSDYTVSNISSDGVGPASNITVYFSNTNPTGISYSSFPPPVGSYISIFGLDNPTKTADRAEGYFVISASNVTSNTANYTAKGPVPSGNIQTYSSYVRRSNIYNSGLVNIPFTTIKTDGNSNIQVFTSNAHGLLPGFPLTCNTFAKFTNETYSNFNGTFFVTNVTSANSFNIIANTYTFGNVGNVTSNMTPSNTTLYVSQFASTQHRPYDGGVLLSTLSPAHGSTVVRQSKKAFRYQSGKGILFSTGTLFCPSLDIASVNLIGTSTTTSGVPTFTSPIVIPVSSTSGMAVGQTLAGPVGSTASSLLPLSNTMGTPVITSIGTGTITASFPGTYPQTLIPTTGTGISANATTTTTGTVLLTGAVNIPCPGPQSNGFVPGQTITGLPKILGVVTVANVAQGAGTGSNIQVTFTGSWPAADIPIGAQIVSNAATTALTTTFTANTTVFTGTPAGQLKLSVGATSLLSNGFTSGQIIAGLHSAFGSPLINTSTTLTSTQVNLDTTATGSSAIPIVIQSGVLISNTAATTANSLIQVISPTLTLPISNLTPSANGFISGQILTLGPPSGFINNLGTVTCNYVGYGYLSANFTGTSNLITSNIPGGTTINLAFNPVLTFPGATYGPASQAWINGTTINVNFTSGQVAGGQFAPGMNLVFSNLSGILTPVNANILAINTLAQNLICYASGSGNISFINQAITGTLPQGNVLAGTFSPPTITINASTISNVITFPVGSLTAGLGPGQTLLGFPVQLGNCIVYSNTATSISITHSNAYSLGTTIASSTALSIVPPVTNTWSATTSSGPGSATIAVQSTSGFVAGMVISFANPAATGTFTNPTITSVGQNSLTFIYGGAGGTIGALSTIKGTGPTATTSASVFVPGFSNVYLNVVSNLGFTSNMFVQGMNLGTAFVTNVFQQGVQAGFSPATLLPYSIAQGAPVTGVAQTLIATPYTTAKTTNVAITSNSLFLTASSTNQMLIGGLDSSLGLVTLASNATPTNPSYLPLTLNYASAQTLPFTITAGTPIYGSANTFSNGSAIATPGNNFSIPVTSTTGFITGQTLNTYSIDGVTLQPLGAMNPVTVAAVGSSYLTCSFQGTYSNISLGNTLTSRTNTTLSSNIQPGTQSFTLPVASTSGFAAGQTIASYLAIGLGTVTISSVPTNSIVANFTGTYPTGNGIPIGTTVTTLPAGSTMTMTTDVVHGVPTSGATATIRNFTTNAINGQGYKISSVTDSRTLSVTTQTALPSTIVNLGDQPRLVLTGWHGSTVRAGCFDDANGLFWEYDGQTLAVVRRQSTFACAGYITVSPQSQILLGTTPTQNSFVSGGVTVVGFTTDIGETSNTFNLYGSANPLHNIQPYQYCQLPGLGYAWVLGQPDFYQVTLGFLPTTSKITITQDQLLAAKFFTPTTRFQDQLKVNDRFTIKGMVHQVTSIQGQGVLTFNPPYRGAIPVTSGVAVKACKIKELRVPQSQFNRDTIDGRGASGYKVDLSRQQMVGIQYTWYGAGFVDFMIRGADGNWLYVHRIRNNNVNDEAYLRSGNLPVRYELSVESRGSVTTLAQDTSQSDSTIYVNDPPTFFPTSNGTLLIDNEMITYTGLTVSPPYSFTGCSRSQPLVYNINDQSRTFTAGASSTHLANTSVNLISCSATPTMTHWGSSFITDGQFDLERGYYFNYSNTSVSVTGTNVSKAFAIRLAPSVSNGLVGDIGQKELLNRAQILLQKLEVTSANNIQTIGYFNPQGVIFPPGQWLNINSSGTGGQPSMTQYMDGGQIIGTPAPGERIFQTIVQGNNQNNLDLTGIKEMANSVIGGNQAFPDGPDVLLIVCQGLGQNSATQVNLFWSEAQA